MMVLLKKDIENLILKHKGSEQDDFAMIKRSFN